MKDNKKQALVKELYEKYPYPQRHNATKEGTIYFANWIAEIFGENTSYWKEKTVLELGCGTGELANGLALCEAKVIGIDFSKTSIKLAKKLSKKLGTNKKTMFILKNILEINEKTFNGKKFDAVIALGSLHHTINAKKGFEAACIHLKKNGLIIIGLYNKYARSKHRAKRILLRILAGNNIENRMHYGVKLFGDLGSQIKNADKYGQVHESYHSVSEIIKWFKENGIEFISSKPEFTTPRIDEIKWLIEKKGAFFVMVGKKK